MTDSKPAKKASVVREKDTPKDVLDRLEKLEADMAELREACGSLPEAVQELTRRLSAFETAAPPEFKKLQPDVVASIVAADPFAEFEALANYKSGAVIIRKGTVLRHDTYPRFIDHVRNGLMLGVPGHQAEVIAKYKAERSAREEAAAAARKEIQARTALAALGSDDSSQ